MSAEDTLAVCLLVILAIAGATLATLLYSLWKNAGKKDELEELLADEGADEDKFNKKGAPAGGDGEMSEPWEKAADWWKE